MLKVLKPNVELLLRKLERALVKLETVESRRLYSMTCFNIYITIQTFIPRLREILEPKSSGI